MISRVGKANIALILGLCVASAAVIYSMINQTSDQTVLSPVSAISPTDVAKVVPSNVESVSSVPGYVFGNNGVDEIESLVQDIVLKLKTDHGNQAQDLVFQVSLKEVLDGLILDYPIKGQALFERIIREAFPEYASEILAVVAKMVIYDTWLLNNMLDLNEMPLLQQKGALWEQRYAIFGQEDAEIIWNTELEAEEERRVSMRKTVDMLHQSKDMMMIDRIQILKNAYDENYFGTAENIVLDSKGVLSQAILGLDSVQQELAEMEPEARQAEIDQVRRLLGFEEGQIAWLSKRDQEREVRWNNGYAYMEELITIESQYQGVELETQREALREKYFKHEASTIKKEEEMLEFYRYKRPRVYGVN